MTAAKPKKQREHKTSAVLRDALKSGIDFAAGGPLTAAYKHVAKAITEYIGRRFREEIAEKDVQIREDAVLIKKLSAALKVSLAETQVEREAHQATKSDLTHLQVKYSDLDTRYSNRVAKEISVLGGRPQPKSDIGTTADKVLERATRPNVDL